MNKNIKILSSLALAGILATSGLAGSVAAATTTDTTTTPSLGVYSKLVTNKTVVPFVLKGKSDKVTISDIKKEYNISKFNGLSVSADNTVVQTGDTFMADGETYTVVVYGDVNNDGTVNSLDALAVEKHAVKSAALTGVELEAGDVVNDGKVNSLDSLAIKKFAVGLTNEVLDKAPAAEQAESTSNYSLTVNENGYINNQNASATTVTIKLAETLSEDDAKTGLTLRLTDSKGTELTKAGVAIAAHTNTVKVEKLNVATKKFVDGLVTVELVETVNAKETVLAKTVVEMNTVAPQVAKVTTDRISTPSATISLENCGEGDIVKMYYVVAANDGDIDTVSSKTAVLDGTELAISGNKVTDVVVSTELRNNTAYEVHYIVENSYGSQSDVLGAVITKDTASVTQPKAVKEIVAPDLTKAANAKFTWTLEDGETAANGYTVTIYKDGNIIAENTKVTSAELDIVANITEAGKYKIGVVVNGDATGIIKASEEKLSKEVEVSALEAVTDITFEVNAQGQKILSWVDPNSENDVTYTVQLLKLNDKDVYETDGKALSVSENKAVLTINDNTIYKAEIVAVAKTGQKAIINSEATISDGFYVVAPGTINPSDITDSSVTLGINTIKVNGQEPTYKVKVYKAKEEVADALTEGAYELIDTKSAVIKEDNNGNKTILVDGLDSDTTYRFQLVADVNGIQGESAPTTPIKTLLATPEITNLTVVKDKEDAVAGTIYYNTTKPIIDGVEIDLSKDYSTEFKNMLKVIGVLHANDIVTIAGETVTMKLASKAYSTTADTLAFGTTAANMNLVIEGNDFQRAITATTGKDKQPSSVILKGTNALFTVTGLNADEIILENGVNVTGNKTYTVAANSTVIINGVQVTTEKEVEIQAVAKALTVVATPDTNNNNLTFVNLNAENYTGTDATITFRGDADNSSIYEGTIKIESVGGSVAVKQTNVNVKNLTLDVVVKDGAKVTLGTDVATANQNVSVTLSEKAVEEGEVVTVDAIANWSLEDEDAEAKVLNTLVTATSALSLIDYNLNVDKDVASLKEALKTAGIATATVEALSDKELTNIVSFMNSFGVNDKGATLTLKNKTTKQVEIVFSEEVAGVEVQGIQ